MRYLVAVLVMVGCGGNTLGPPDGDAGPVDRSGCVGDYFRCAPDLQRCGQGQWYRSTQKIACLNDGPTYYIRPKYPVTAGHIYSCDAGEQQAVSCDAGCSTNYIGDPYCQAAP